MIVTSRRNAPRGKFDGFVTWLLIGEKNAGAKEVSIQLTHVEPGCEQFLHDHPQEQCYYVIEGQGLMTIGGEKEEVGAGKAVLIPGNASHGIRNTGEGTLVYLTANAVFGAKHESRVWPKGPDQT